MAKFELMNQQISYQDPLLPIGIVSNILNIHQRTLRIYDKAGILCPSRTSKKHRYYSFADVEKGKFIIFLTRKVGLNIIGIKIILNLLSKLAIAPADYQSYIEKLAEENNITLVFDEMLASKRGRPIKLKQPVES